MKEEFKRIRKICKEIVGKESYKKVKSLRDYGDRTESLKHMVSSKLELKILDIEYKLAGIDKKETKVLELKLARLKSKIKIFKSSYLKRDYMIIENLINEIEEKIKNV